MTILETPRLILRPTTAEDFEPLATMMADPDTQFIGGPLTREGAWRVLALLAGSWSLYGFSMFSYIEKSTGQFVGRGGPWRPEGWPGPEVGWGLIPSAQGKGYAVEAATACIDWAFDELGWNEVVHCIDAANGPSRAVAQRLGSTLLRHATLPAPLNWPVEVWGQTREEWRARKVG